MTNIQRGALARVIGGVLAALAVAATLPTASAHATVPNARDRADGKRFARDYWRARGYETTCSGVRIGLRPFYERTAHGDLGYVRHGRCTIWLNSLEDWSRVHGYGHRASWWRTCATIIHEYGHLPGIERPHTFRAASIMAVSESLNTQASWWPYFPDCRYDGDDHDGDDVPDL